MALKKPSLLIFLALITALSCCKPIIRIDNSGKVIKIKDGDSIVLLDDHKQQVEIRLAHIDAPEFTQPYGKKSREFLADMIAGEHIQYSIYEDRDRYGRIVAELYLRDTINVNQEMVSNGYAWHFKRYSNSFTYGKLERAARQAGLGLWAEPDAVAPWNWRK